jgi:hypothetical protein
VNSVPLQVLLYAIVAGASPIALGAALVVLGSRGGRWNALAFAVGVVLGQTVVCALGYAVGSAALPVGHHAHETARAVLEITFGVALVVTGLYVRSRPELTPTKPNPRTKAVFERLAHLNLPAVFGAGAALSVGPKRLAITLLVTATISAADLPTVEAVALSVTYVVVATALVTVPVGLAILFGSRAQRWMADVQEWLSAHRRSLTSYPLAVLGVVIVADGVVGALR